MSLVVAFFLGYAASVLVSMAAAMILVRRHRDGGRP